MDQVAIGAIGANGTSWFVHRPTFPASFHNWLIMTSHILTQFYPDTSILDEFYITVATIPCRVTRKLVKASTIHFTNMGLFTWKVPVASVVHVINMGAFSHAPSPLQLAAQCTTSLGAHHVLIGHAHTADGCGIVYFYVCSLARKSKLHHGGDPY